MTATTVKSVVTRFLKDDKDTAQKVLALKGAWGVGKTYEWNKIIKDLKDQIRPANYCYVSLFGITTLSELRLAIATKTQNARLIGKELGAETINEEWFSLGGHYIKQCTGFFSRFKDTSVGKHLSIGWDTIAHHLIKNTIVCLDDFERLSDGVKPEELLGFISSLKEEKGCKIVLIFNEDDLGDKKETYEKCRHKVVDIELLFAPSTKEATEIAFPKEMPSHDLAVNCVVSLGIKNIRILRKIAALVALVNEDLKRYQPGVMAQAVKTIILLAWAFYDKSGEKPSFEFILKEWKQSFLFGLIDRQGGENKRDPKIVRWDKILNNYCNSVELVFRDEFNFAIAKIIEHGYIEETGLPEEAAKLNNQIQADDQKESFMAAWKPLHNTFTDNKDELIQGLINNLKRSVHRISPDDLNQTVQIFRKLDENISADSLIDYYIEERGKEARLFDLSNYPFLANIDSVLNDRFAQQHARTQKKLSLKEVTTGLVGKNGWSKNDVEVLQAATVDDFYNLFKLDHGDTLSSIIEACQVVGGTADYQSIGKNIREALERIGNESTLNAIRVKKFGVVIPKRLDSV